MTPLTCEALETRIAELEQERDELLRTTEFVRYGPCKTSHSKIKVSYGTRIGCLRKHGVEYAHQLQDVKDKTEATKHARHGKGGIVNYNKAVQTKLERYGNKSGNSTKRIKTNIERYGNAYGNQQKVRDTLTTRYGRCGCVNVEQALNTKRQRYGNGHGNINKMLATRIERYGNKGCNAKQAVKTRKVKYGNAAGNIAKMSETCMQRYGVPWHCMTAKCRNAQGRVKSKANHWWHNKLLQELGIDCGLDDVNLENRSYDLSYANGCCKLLIEVNPTITHNSTISYIYLVGKSKDNWPTGMQYHFDKTQLALKHGYTCITIFEWMDDNEVIDAIRKHLAGEPVDSTDFALNPQLSDDKSTIRKHWCHLKTKEHIEDCGQDEQEMIDAGYVAVYDCGHAR